MANRHARPEINSFQIYNFNVRAQIRPVLSDPITFAFFCGLRSFVLARPKGAITQDLGGGQ